MRTPPATRSRAPSPSAETGAADSIPEPAHLELRIWLRLLGCTAQIENYLRTRLRAEFGISLARFDLMAQLDRRPAGVSMSDISRLLLVSNGAVTGLVDRLVKEGMVTRKSNAGDRRAFIVSFTPAGRRAFAKMAKRHEEWVLSLLGDIPIDAKQQLLGQLVHLKRRLEDTR
ncbi:MAG TPA: MarR family transcriptional regulator [Magnetospirillaceae bacterium]|jgi:DNA-binding MarR family transcriptional regulator